MVAEQESSMAFAIARRANAKEASVPALNRLLDDKRRRGAEECDHVGFHRVPRIRILAQDIAVGHKRPFTYCYVTREGIGMTVVAWNSTEMPRLDPKPQATMRLTRKGQR